MYSNLEDFKSPLEFNHQLPVCLLQVFTKEVLHSIDGFTADLWTGQRHHYLECTMYSCWVHVCLNTLLTSKSSWSKWRPYILGASDDDESILIQTSDPLRAMSTGLWLASILTTWPSSQNWTRIGRWRLWSAYQRRDATHILAWNSEGSAWFHNTSLYHHTNHYGITWVVDTVWENPQLAWEDGQVLILFPSSLLQFLYVHNRVRSMDRDGERKTSV